ncbi:hypothetical protein RvY_15402-2 [Ramazzottius varieornatus]|uniref:Uncharacterized protein n=1 Tax=Ramazzottius varieornatus TaxID=947166 RepID=A0A1D1VUT0_RAMVA|nr:hypothetical protein RvY_15402-2 [Ramazzottius varieornatus]
MWTASCVEWSARRNFEKLKTMRELSRGSLDRLEVVEWRAWAESGDFGCGNLDSVAIDGPLDVRYCFGGQRHP